MQKQKTDSTTWHKSYLYDSYEYIRDLRYGGVFCVTVVWATCTQQYCRLLACSVWMGEDTLRSTRGCTSCDTQQGCSCIDTKPCSSFSLQSACLAMQTTINRTLGSSSSVPSSQTRLCFVRWMWGSTTDSWRSTVSSSRARKALVRCVDAMSESDDQAQASTEWGILQIRTRCLDLSYSMLQWMTILLTGVLQYRTGQKDDEHPTSATLSVVFFSGTTAFEWGCSVLTDSLVASAVIGKKRTKHTCGTVGSIPDYPTTMPRNARNTRIQAKATIIIIDWRFYRAL